MSGKIERGITRLHQVRLGDALRFVAEAGEILLGKMRIAELGILEVAARLADEVIDRRCGHARNLVLDGRQAARADRELAFAAEREQAAVALDDDLLFRDRHGNDVGVILTQFVAAGRGHVPGHLDEQGAGMVDAQAKGVRRGGVRRGRNQRGLQTAGARERRGVHLVGGPGVEQTRRIQLGRRFGFGGIAVVLIAVAVAVLVVGRIIIGVGRIGGGVVVVLGIVPGGLAFGLAGRVVGGQSVERERPGEVLRTDLTTRVHQEELLGVAVLVLDDAGAGSLDVKEAVEIGHDHFVGGVEPQRFSARGRGQAGGEAQLHGVRLRRQGERDRAEKELTPVAAGRQGKKLVRRGRAEHGRTTGHGDRDAALESGGVDGVGGEDRRGDLADGEILRILIKLRLREMGLERQGTGFQVVAGQVGVRGQRGRMDRDAKRLGCGPFAGELEDEQAVALPAPYSRQGGFQPNQVGAPLFIAQPERGCRRVDPPPELGRRACVRQRGHLRGEDLGVDEVRRDGHPPVEVGMARPEACAHGGERSRGFPTMRAQEGSRDAQPTGPLPGDVADRGSRRSLQKVPDARGKTGKMVTHASVYVVVGGNLTTFRKQP